MRIFAAVAVLVTAIVPVSAQSRDDLYATWLNPPLEYRMNRNIHQPSLDSAGQDWLIRTTLDDGWGGFALNVPFNRYLTDEGMKATKQFCEKARAKGMDLWLYDEQGYPSGSAGGRVIAENPSWESMGLFFTDAIVDGGDSVTFEMPPGEPVQIVAFAVLDGKPDYAKPIDLMDLFDGPQLKWNAPEGKWRIFAATQCGLHKGFQAERNPYRYPSLMIPEVTDAFLRITHDRYVEYMGDDLGRYFTSTFTDEPSSMAMQFHGYPYKHAVIPWQEVLSVEMKKRYGYRPEEKLIALYYDEGPAGQEVRYQYFKTVGDLMAENFFGRIRDWCKSHNFKFGGHLLLEETMIADVPLYGNIMQCFRAMDAPGIDILSCLPENMPVHSPKLASSAAELMGQNRVMSEPCPVADGPNEPPLQSVRGHLNMLLQGGISDFNCYLSLKNLSRAERIELNTYVGRVGMLLRGGHTIADIGVVYPIESLWTKYTPRYHKVAGWKQVVGATSAVNAVDRAFQSVGRFMFDHRWEYLDLDARALMDARAQNAELLLDPFRFKVIVLPAVSTLPAEAWSRLLEYAEQGGKLVFLEEMPLNSDVSFPDAAVRNAFDRYARENENVVFMKDWTGEALDELLCKWLSRAVQIDDEKLPLRLAHKKVDDSEVFFVINDSANEVATNVSFRTSEELEEWEPATGKVRSVSNETKVVLKPYHGKIYRTLGGQTAEPSSRISQAVQ